MNFKKYIAELKKRHVFKAGLAYLVGAWVFTEVSSLVLDTFAAPPYVMKTILIVLVIGFPIWLIFSWVYDLTPEGIKNVPGLIEIYQTSVLMDFTPNEISKLLCLITKIDLKNDIVFTEFPQQMLEEARVYDKVQESDMYVLLPDHELVVGLLADFQLGRWP